MSSTPRPGPDGREPASDAASGPIAAVEVRPLRASDVDATIDMFAAVVAEDRWLGTEDGFDREERAASWLASLDDPSRRMFVADVGGGRIVGNGSLGLASFGVASIGMAIAADWRGRGLGGRVLDALLGEARGMGAHKVALEVWPHNEPAIALYDSRGFRVEGRLVRHYRRRDGALWDSIVMGLPLDEQ